MAPPACRVQVLEPGKEGQVLPAAEAAVKASSLQVIKPRWRLASRGRTWALAALDEECGPGWALEGWR